MPLHKGKSQAVIHENFKELRRSGKDEKQAWAIALSFSGTSRDKQKKAATKIAKKDYKKIKGGK